MVKLKYCNTLKIHADTIQYNTNTDFLTMYNNAKLREIGREREREKKDAIFLEMIRQTHKNVGTNICRIALLIKKTETGIFHIFI